MNVLILPMGFIGDDIIHEITHFLSKTLTKINILHNKINLKYPIDTYNVVRNQYNSKKILNKLSSTLNNNDITICILNKDLYTPGLSFIFGEALPKDKIAIISSYRLNPEYYNEQYDKCLFIMRCTKEIIHEIGHLLNLIHCDNNKCVMSFSRNIIDADNKNILFCDECYRKISVLHDLY